MKPNAFGATTLRLWNEEFLNDNPRYSCDGPTVGDRANSKAASGAGPASALDPYETADEKLFSDMSSFAADLSGRGYTGRVREEIVCEGCERASSKSSKKFCGDFCRNLPARKQSTLVILSLRS